MKAICVIPARFASTRFPGKALTPVLGKPMIQWVWDRACLAGGLDEVIVATDDNRIFQTVESFGGKAVMTPSDCASGSDRVWRVVEGIDCDVVVNIQGDEPTLDPAAIEALLELMEEDPSLEMGTLVSPLVSREEYENPTVVKVVMGEGNRCLYFSRSPVPHLREGWGKGEKLFRHVGVYAFRKKFLGRFTGWPVGMLEAAEKLEQLRAIERGVMVRAAVVEWSGTGVDVPSDVPFVEEALRTAGAHDTQ